MNKKEEMGKVASICTYCIKVISNYNVSNYNEYNAFKRLQVQIGWNRHTDLLIAQCLSLDQSNDIHQNVTDEV